jgi:hypothetical protein
MTNRGRARRGVTIYISRFWKKLLRLITKHLSSHPWVRLQDYKAALLPQKAASLSAQPQK